MLGDLRKNGERYDLILVKFETLPLRSSSESFTIEEDLTD